MDNNANKYPSSKNNVFNSLLVIGIVFTSGCATNEVTTKISTAFDTAVSSVRSGLGEIGKSNFDASNFAKDDVPHILLKKPVAHGKLTSGFGYRLSPTGVRLPKKHKGVDYVSMAGTPVFAAGDGEIIKLYVSNSYGNRIIIKHAKGFKTTYSHMREFAPGLEKGSTVTKGQTIGTVGSTGRSTGPHLHYEMLYNGKFIDPLFY